MFKLIGKSPLHVGTVRVVALIADDVRVVILIDRRDQFLAARRQRKSVLTASL
jgi:hypothetical protein